VTPEFSVRERERLVEAAGRLREAEKPVRVLRAVAWPEDAAERFFGTDGGKLPEVEYSAIDPAPALEQTKDARKLIDGDSPVHGWLQRIADVIETGARMVATVGTPDFYALSSELYGTPKATLPDNMTTPLDLARQLDGVLSGFSHRDLHLTDEPVTFSAEQLIEQMRPMIAAHFGDAAPRLELIDHMASKVIAGGRYIRVRKGARFSDRDRDQLVQHEAFVHIGTTLNGHAQTAMRLLAAGHPGTTATQEGLAVFAEIISGSMDPSRMRRLADRVIAIQMSIDGADFVELYRFFLERTDQPREAFENARRVVRGGVMTGGAPFTKDGVYLGGLLRVHNFLRVAVQLDRLDCIRLIFAGKMDIEDLPALCMMAQAGLCSFPKFLPPWASDLRFLVSYLSYSAFLNRVNLEAVRVHYREMFDRAPKIDLPDELIDGALA
jgi:uncharacterized protein (TIGR02421 family)